MSIQFILLSFYIICCINLSNTQIANDCNTDSKTCISFSGCSETTSTTNMDIATIKTTGIDTVEFELQFSGASTEWIAIGLSTSASMLNTYVFLCYRTSGSSVVTVQERKTSNTVRSRPPVVTSNMDTLSTSNSEGILNCKFTSPITRTPQLDDATGYYVLLARGSYSSDINQHTSRCVGPRIQIADPTPFQAISTSSVMPSSSISIPSSTPFPSSTPIPSSTSFPSSTIQFTSIPSSSVVPSTLVSSSSIIVPSSSNIPSSTDVISSTTHVPPMPLQVCGAEGTVCLKFSDCSSSNIPADNNVARFYTLSQNTVQFHLQFDDISIGWIALGISDTPSMTDSSIFLCHRLSNGTVAIEERYAPTTSTPSVVVSQLTTVEFSNSDSILSCTFTSPVSRTPMLNRSDGYHILLARGVYDSDIVYHGEDKCIGPRIRITDALGSVDPTVSTVPATTTPSTGCVLIPVAPAVLAVLLVVLMLL